MSEKEYELKIQITGTEAERIRKIIASTKSGEIFQQEDIYFYPKEMNVFEYMNKKCIRIRRNNNVNSLEYKELFDDTNVYMQKMVEYSTDISDADQMQNILMKIGLCKSITVKKERWQCTYKNQCKLCLDFVAELGCFLEIELLNTKEEDAILIARIQKVLRELGISEIKINKAGYSNMLLKKKYGGE